MQARGSLESETKDNTSNSRASYPCDSGSDADVRCSPRAAPDPDPDSNPGPGGNRAPPRRDPPRDDGRGGREEDGRDRPGSVPKRECEMIGRWMYTSVWLSGYRFSIMMIKNGNTFTRPWSFADVDDGLCAH